MKTGRWRYVFTVFFAIIDMPSEIRFLDSEDFNRCD